VVATGGAAVLEPANVSDGVAVTRVVGAVARSPSSVLVQLAMSTAHTAVATTR